MNTKKGISLVVLGITIIVIIILASTAIFISNDTFVSSRLSSFALDLNNIEDLVEEYYLSNNELPVITEESYSKEEVVNMITKGRNILSEEITLNKDDANRFYPIDLTKLPIESNTRGLKADGDSADIYVVAQNSFNVYYLKGEKIRDNYYFSLNEKLTGKIQTNNDITEDDSNITITKMTSGIKYTKSSKEWTNNLTVNIDTTLDENQTISYTISGIQAGSSTVGNFIIDVAKLVVDSTEIRDAFYAENANKTLIINKYDTSSGSEVLIATSNVDISNLDTISGNVVAAENITYRKYPDYILANVSGYTDLGGSGVKEARVLYTEKTDSEGNKTLYYDNLPSELTSEYIYNSGKVLEYNLLKLSGDVSTFAIVFVDNAGNISNPATYSVNY